MSRGSESVKRPSVGQPEYQLLLRGEEMEPLVSSLRALGHPVRLKMIDLIHCHGGDICVCDFEDHFDLRQPTISYHLKILRDAGLIRSTQQGPEIRHHIKTDGFRHLGRLMEAFSAP